MTDNISEDDITTSYSRLEANLIRMGGWMADEVIQQPFIPSVLRGHREQAEEQLKSLRQQHLRSLEQFRDTQAVNATAITDLNKDLENKSDEIDKLKAELADCVKEKEQRDQREAEQMQRLNTLDIALERLTDVGDKLKRSQKEIDTLSDVVNELRQARNQLTELEQEGQGRKVNHAQELQDLRDRVRHLEEENIVIPEIRSNLQDAQNEVAEKSAHITRLERLVGALSQFGGGPKEGTYLNTIQVLPKDNDMVRQESEEWRVKFVQQELAFAELERKQGGLQQVKTRLQKFKTDFEEFTTQYHRCKDSERADMQYRLNKFQLQLSNLQTRSQAAMENGRATCIKNQCIYSTSMVKFQAALNDFQDDFVTLRAHHERMVRDLVLLRSQENLVHARELSNQATQHRKDIWELMENIKPRHRPEVDAILELSSGSILGKRTTDTPPPSTKRQKTVQEDEVVHELSDDSGVVQHDQFDDDDDNDTGGFVIARPSDDPLNFNEDDQPQSEFVSASVQASGSNDVPIVDDQQPLDLPAQGDDDDGIEEEATAPLGADGTSDHNQNQTQLVLAPPAPVPQPSLTFTIPTSTNPTQLANDMFSLFHPMWDITAEEEGCIKDQWRSAFSGNRRQKEFLEAVEMVDKHIFGDWTKGEPPTPRCCLMANVVLASHGPGGPTMTQGSCPYCKKGRTQKICTWALHAPNVTSGFRPRVNGRLEPDQRDFNVDVNNLTVTLDGHQRRYLLFRRKQRQGELDVPGTTAVTSTGTTINLP